MVSVRILWKTKAVGYLKDTVADLGFRKSFFYRHLRNTTQGESLRREKRVVNGEGLVEAVHEGRGRSAAERAGHRASGPRLLPGTGFSAGGDRRRQVGLVARSDEAHAGGAGG